MIGAVVLIALVSAVQFERGKTPFLRPMGSPCSGNTIVVRDLILRTCHDAVLAIDRRTRSVTALPVPGPVDAVATNESRQLAVATVDESVDGLVVVFDQAFKEIQRVPIIRPGRVQALRWGERQWEAVTSREIFRFDGQTVRIEPIEDPERGPRPDDGVNVGVELIDGEWNRLRVVPHVRPDAGAGSAVKGRRGPVCSFAAPHLTSDTDVTEHRLRGRGLLWPISYFELRGHSFERSRFDTSETLPWPATCLRLKRWDRESSCTRFYLLHTDGVEFASKCVDDDRLWIGDRTKLWTDGDRLWNEGRSVVAPGKVSLSRLGSDPGQFELFVDLEGRPMLLRSDLKRLVIYDESLEVVEDVTLRYAASVTAMVRPML